MENEIYEAMLVSTATGVTFIQANSENMLKLKVFTFMSRDFETAVGNFDLNYRDFLEKFSVHGTVCLVTFLFQRIFQALQDQRFVVHQEDPFTH